MDREALAGAMAASADVGATEACPFFQEKNYLEGTRTIGGGTCPISNRGLSRFGRY